MVIWRVRFVQFLLLELLLSLAFAGEPIDVNRRASGTDSSRLDATANVGETRTTIFQISSAINSNFTTTVTTTVTTEFSCQVPLVLDTNGLMQYTSCIKTHCQEMQSDAMKQASGGTITDCFLLLEAAGGCAADASLQVTDLQSLDEDFEVGDLCGPFCPAHCQDSETTSSRPISTSGTLSSPSTVFEEELDEQVPSTSTPQETSPTTTLDLVAAAGRLRVLLSSLTFRISNPEGFNMQTGIRNALRDGIAATLVVSPSQVVILNVELEGAQGKATSAQDGGNLRRLQVHGNGMVRVPFEILNPPHFLDATLLLDESTADAMEMHLKQLFVTRGGETLGTISDVKLEEPQLVFREVTKKETTVDEWFFTYPADSKDGNLMEPLEPGITNSRSGRLSVRAGLFAGLFALGLLHLGV